MWFSGYYKCQKSPKIAFHLPIEGPSMLRRGAIAPLAPPLISSLVQPRSNSSGGTIWIYPKIIIIIIQYLDRFAWNPQENSMNIP